VLCKLAFEMLCLLKLRVFKKVIEFYRIVFVCVSFISIKPLSGGMKMLDVLNLSLT
jgi:hypothetical protein